MTNDVIDIRFESVDAKHADLFFGFECNKKSCGRHEHFREFLCFNAISDRITGAGMTHVMCEYKDNKPYAICGFVTLKASVLITDSDAGSVTGEPAIEISELAVDKRYERQGIGRDLLLHALRMCKLLHDNHIGVMHMVVRADEKAVGFYRHVLKFQPLANHYVVPNEIWNAGCTPMYLKLEKLFINR